MQNADQKNSKLGEKKHTEAVCLVCFGGEIIGLNDLPILQLFQFHLVFWRTLSPKKNQNAMAFDIEHECAHHLADEKSINQNL